MVLYLKHNIKFSKFSLYLAIQRNQGLPEIKNKNQRSQDLPETKNKNVSKKKRSFFKFNLGTFNISLKDAQC